MDEETQFDWQVRRHVYDVAMHRGYPPLVAEISNNLNLSLEKIQAALQRLAAGRVLVLQPNTGEILMANPFSAVPTPFLVEVSGFSCYSNCIWDALGIPAMLKQDAHIKTACGDCGLGLELRVVNSQIQGDPSLIHFAIPAHHWWDDIVFN
jgi:Alkylmercury lyase